MNTKASTIRQASLRFTELLLALGLVTGLVSTTSAQERHWPLRQEDWAVVPNPFDDFAALRYSLPEPCSVTVKAYDVTGAVAAVLVSDQPAGRAGTMSLDARPLPAGLYLLAFQAGQYVSVKPVVKLDAGTGAGVQFLNCWPTARSAALAGATTALADEPDVVSPNLGGLGFQKSFRFGGVFGQLLPTSSTGMYMGLAGANIGFPNLLEENEGE